MHKHIDRRIKSIHSAAVHNAFAYIPHFTLIYYILMRLRMNCNGALEIMQYHLPHQLNSNWNECVCVWIFHRFKSLFGSIFIFHILFISSIYFYSFVLVVFLLLQIVDMVISLRPSLVRQEQNKNTCVWMYMLKSFRSMNKWVVFLSFLLSFFYRSYCCCYVYVCVLFWFSFSFSICVTFFWHGRLTVS